MRKYSTSDNVANHFLVQVSVIDMIPVGILDIYRSNNNKKNNTLGCSNSRKRFLGRHVIVIVVFFPMVHLIIRIYIMSTCYRTWKMMASRSSWDHVLKMVLMISRNFSLSRTLGSSFLKYWIKS